MNGTRKRITFRLDELNKRVAGATNPESLQRALNATQKYLYEEQLGLKTGLKPVGR